jgi:murein peptide amidase A
MRSYTKEVLQKITALDSSYSVRELGDVDVPGGRAPLIAVRVSRGDALPEVYLQAGLHGNEPAPIYALLNFLENGIERYTNFFNFTVVPCANPSGFELDQRKNMHEVDINRNFASPTPEHETALMKSFIESEAREYLMVADMHEDPTHESVEGFALENNPRELYIYERSPSPEDSLARPIIETFRAAGVPIYAKNTLYADHIDRGVVREGATGTKMDESSFYVVVNEHARYILTPETPTCWELDYRVSVQTQFLTVMLDELKKKI